MFKLSLRVLNVMTIACPKTNEGDGKQDGTLRDLLIILNLRGHKHIASSHEKAYDKYSAA